MSELNSPSKPIPPPDIGALVSGGERGPTVRPPASIGEDAAFGSLSPVASTSTAPGSTTMASKPRTAFPSTVATNPGTTSGYTGTAKIVSTSTAAAAAEPHPPSRGLAPSTNYLGKSGGSSFTAKAPEWRPTSAVTESMPTQPMASSSMYMFPPTAAPTGGMPYMPHAHMVTMTPQQQQHIANVMAQQQQQQQQYPGAAAAATVVSQVPPPLQHSHVTGQGAGAIAASQALPMRGTSPGPQLAMAMAAAPSTLASTIDARRFVDETELERSTLIGWLLALVEGNDAARSFADAYVDLIVLQKQHETQQQRLPPQRGAPASALATTSTAPPLPAVTSGLLRSAF